MIHSPGRLAIARNSIENLAAQVLPHCMGAHLVIQAGNDPDRFDPRKWAALAVEVATHLRLESPARIDQMLTQADADQFIGKLAGDLAKGKP